MEFLEHHPIADHVLDIVGHHRQHVSDELEPVRHRLHRRERAGQRRQDFGGGGSSGHLGGTFAPCLHVRRRALKALGSAWQCQGRCRSPDERSDIRERWPRMSLRSCGLRDRGLAPARISHTLRLSPHQSIITDGHRGHSHGPDPRLHSRRAGPRARHPHRAVAEGRQKGRADQGRRLRRLRHRSAHPERALAEAAALAVHARPRARRNHRRMRRRIHRGLHEQAAQGRIESDDPAADALRPLLLLHPLSADRQQMPDAGLLRPLSRLRQGAAHVGRLGRICLCRSRDAAGHQDLQVA